MRAAIHKSFTALDHEPDLLPEEAWADAEPHVLFGYQYDSDMTLYLYAIPTAALSEALRTSLQTVNYQAFAYHELMIGDDASKAFMRIEAAAAVEDWEDLLECFEDEAIPDFGEEIPESDRECWEAYAIGELGDDVEITDGGLAKRFVASYMVRRCN